MSTFVQARDTRVEFVSSWVKLGVLVFSCVMIMMRLKLMIVYRTCGLGAL